MALIAVANDCVRPYRVCIGFGYRTVHQVRIAGVIWVTLNGVVGECGAHADHPHLLSASVHVLDFEGFS